MLPSTRTPEGDPLQCLICGNEHLVLASWPPGDSVCPSCGAHSWLPRPTKDRELSKVQIRQRVHTLIDQLRLSVSEQEVGNALVKGIVQCLSAQSALYWTSKRGGDTAISPLELIAFAGTPKDSRFAEEVADLKANTIRQAYIGSVESLLIGIPIKMKAERIAVIEVVHSAKLSIDCQNGYLRFVRSMAECARSCRALR